MKHNKSKASVSASRPTISDNGYGNSASIPVSVKYENGAETSDDAIVNIKNIAMTKGLKETGYENLPNWMKILLRRTGQALEMSNTTMHNMLHKDHTGGGTGFWQALNSTLRELELGTVKSGRSGKWHQAMRYGGQLVMLTKKAYHITDLEERWKAACVCAISVRSDRLAY